MTNVFEHVRAADARRRSAAAGATETAIFEATERLLEAMPLHDLSVAHIVTAADTSRATFYRYFTSKDAVVAGLLAKVMDEVFEPVSVLLEGDASARAMPIDAALRDAWAVLAGHVPVLRAVSENWHRIPELQSLWLSIVDRFVDAIAGQIDRERAAGLAPAGTDSTALATMLVWSAERMMYIASGPVPGALHGVERAVGPVGELWRSAVYGDIAHRADV